MKCRYIAIFPQQTRRTREARVILLCFTGPPVPIATRTHWEAWVYSRNGPTAHLLVVRDELCVHHLLLDVPDGAGGVDGGGADAVRVRLVPVKRGQRRTELAVLLVVQHRLQLHLVSGPRAAAKPLVSPFCDGCPLSVYSLSPSAIGARYGYILFSLPFCDWCPLR
eukprot:556391-Prorocentrum_minimum.AAC.1